MIEQRMYTSDELPATLHCQILSFLRIVWPEGFTGPNRLRTWISGDPARTLHLVLVEDDTLISHTEVKWKELRHAGETYKVYGLSGVFTYPSFRGHGYGRRIVEAGTAYIRVSDADIAMFHCAPHLRDFYARGGWIPMDGAITLVGDMAAPHASDELMMMLFLSEKGRRNRAAFESEPVYFGGDTW